MKITKQRHLQGVNQYLTSTEVRRFLDLMVAADKYKTGPRRGSALAQAKRVLRTAKKGGA